MKKKFTSLWFFNLWEVYYYSTIQAFEMFQNIMESSDLDLPVCIDCSVQ